MNRKIFDDTTLIADDQWVPIGRGYEKYDSGDFVYIRRGADKEFVAGGTYEGLGTLMMHAAAEGARVTRIREDAAAAISKEKAKRS